MKKKSQKKWKKSDVDRLHEVICSTQQVYHKFYNNNRTAAMLLDSEFILTAWKSVLLECDFLVVAFSNKTKNVVFVYFVSCDFLSKSLLIFRLSLCALWFAVMQVWIFLSFSRKRAQSERCSLEDKLTVVHCTEHHKWPITGTSSGDSRCNYEASSTVPPKRD